MASFVGLVALRAPLLNHRGDLVGLGILGMLVIAFIGGLLFKGRSGWCGTFCPLGANPTRLWPCPVSHCTKRLLSNLHWLPKKLLRL